MGANLIKYTYDEDLKFHNEARTKVEWNKKQAYQAWGADPKKYEGFWDTVDGRPGDFSVPHYSIYKIDGIPELEYVKRTLAKDGLTDPWLRNEVWRYPPDKARGPNQLIIDVMCGKKFFGVKYGLALAASVIICENIWWKYKYGGKPEWGHDFRDFWHDLHTYKPNQ